MDRLDLHAIIITCACTFLIGLIVGEGSLGLAILIGLPMYIIIRYFQTEGE